MIQTFMSTYRYLLKEQSPESRVGILKRVNNFKGETLRRKSDGEYLFWDGYYLYNPNNNTVDTLVSLSLDKYEIVEALNFSCPEADSYRESKTISIPLPFLLGGRRFIGAYNKETSELRLTHPECTAYGNLLCIKVNNEIYWLCCGIRHSKIWIDIM